MNILLFSEQADRYRIQHDDPKNEHIRKVLRMSVGDSLFIGAINGPRGKARIEAMGTDSEITISVQWDQNMQSPAPLHLLVGLPRPQTARKILQECTTLGVSSIHFFQTAKGEPSYANSKLWQTDEWKRHLITGAEQAFNTTVPEIQHHASLKAAAATIASLESATRLALDIYEAPQPLGKTKITSKECFLAIGPERGWSAEEREVLRDHHFTLVHLGQRVLRTESACACGAIILLNAMGYLSQPYIG